MTHASGGVRPLTRSSSVPPPSTPIASGLLAPPTPDAFSPDLPRVLPMPTSALALSVAPCHDPPTAPGNLSLCPNQHHCRSSATQQIFPARTGDAHDNGQQAAFEPSRPRSKSSRGRIAGMAAGIAHSVAELPPRLAPDAATGAQILLVDAASSGPERDQSEASMPDLSQSLNAGPESSAAIAWGQLLP